MYATLGVCLGSVARLAPRGVVFVLVAETSFYWVTPGDLLRPPPLYGWVAWSAICRQVVRVVAFVIFVSAAVLIVVSAGMSATYVTDIVSLTYTLGCVIEC